MDSFPHPGGKVATALQRVVLMAEHLGDAADSVGPAAGGVAQGGPAAAPAHLVVTWTTNQHFG